MTAADPAAGVTPSLSLAAGSPTVLLTGDLDTSSGPKVVLQLTPSSIWSCSCPIEVWLSCSRAALSCGLSALLFAGAGTSGPRCCSCLSLSFLEGIHGAGKSPLLDLIPGLPSEVESTLHHADNTDCLAISCH